MFKSMQLTMHYFSLKIYTHTDYGYFLLLFLHFRQVMGMNRGWSLSQFQINAKDLFCIHLLGVMTMSVSRENARWRRMSLINVALIAFDILDKEVSVLSHCSLTDSHRWIKTIKKWIGTNFYSAFDCPRGSPKAKPTLSDVGGSRIY